MQLPSGPNIEVPVAALNRPSGTLSRYCFRLGSKSGSSRRPECLSSRRDISDFFSGLAMRVARHLCIILRHAPSPLEIDLMDEDFRDVVGCSGAGEVSGKRWGESGILHHSGRPASLRPSSHLENTLDRSFKYLPRIDTRNSGSSVRTFAKVFSAS